MVNQKIEARSITAIQGKSRKHADENFCTQSVKIELIM